MLGEGRYHVTFAPTRTIRPGSTLPGARKFVKVDPVAGAGSAGADVPLGPTIGENTGDRTVKYASEFSALNTSTLGLTRTRPNKNRFAKPMSSWLVRGVSVVPVGSSGTLIQGVLSPQPSPLAKGWAPGSSRASPAGPRQPRRTADTGSHELVLAGIHLEPAEVRECAVEETDRMRIVDFGEELDDVAVSRSESGRRPLSDTVEPQDRGALEGRWVKTEPPIYASQQKKENS